MDHAKIAKAAELCLEASAQTDHPFVVLAAFIKGLEDSPNWAEPEIAAVQAQVTRALLKRIEDSEA